MKTQMARLIRSDGSEEVLRPANGKKFELGELQKAVGGFIEHVSLKPGNGRGVAYINEEGKLLGLPRNPKATEMVRLFAGDFIVGNLVVTGRE